MSFTLVEPDYSSADWDDVPLGLRPEIRALVRTFLDAPSRGVAAWLKQTALALDIPEPTLRRKYYALKNSSGDWRVLVDGRKVVAPAEQSRTQRPAFRAELVRRAESHQRNSLAAFRKLRQDWKDRSKTIPGYEDWPGWPKMPSGWSNRNFYTILGEETNQARLRSIRVGTSSKTNRFLPSVITTRVGLWVGAVRQVDDVLHDTFISVGARRELTRVMEFGSHDLYSAKRQHWGAKPRVAKLDGSGMEALRLREMRFFLAGDLHKNGRSTFGTMYMSEHNTAKIGEDIERILYDFSNGMIRVERQPIEGKQAALSGYWSGSEGGNFRAKAALESCHNLIHNDLGHLLLQTGLNPDSRPVTTDRQLAYIARVVRDVLKKFPQRAHLLKLPVLDFHTQFWPLVSDYYEHGLNGRSDHDLEGWAKLGFKTREYTTLPGSEHFLSEQDFLALPDKSQAIIAAAAQADPESWTRFRNLSPNEVYARGKNDLIPVPNSLLCEIIGQDLAREVKCSRGFLEFDDLDISPDPLIYKARLLNTRREIPHGEKVAMFANPYDTDTAFIVDAKFRYLGEVALYKKVLPINPDSFHTDQPFESRPEIRSADLSEAAGEKRERIADILEPTRILHAEVVQEAKDLRAHNARVVSGKPVTDEEIAEARSEAGRKGQRTAAANRLQQRGSERDWDNEPIAAPAAPFDPLAGLNDETPLPDSL